MFRPAVLTLAALLAATAACGTDAPPNLSWEAFRAQAYREPDAGVFVYDGDVTAADEKALKRAWARHFAPGRRTDVAIPAKAWSAMEARRITFCVSLQFGNRHQEVVAAIEAAAAEWSAEADVVFVHDAMQDFRCGPANEDVVFDVAPVFRAPYLARAFTPGDTRAHRRLLIDDGAFDRSVSFVGLLRHELGHVLGLNHLQARPEAAPCFEDSEWRPPFETEAVSTMVYPSCDGRGDWELSITDNDRAALRSLYGPPGSRPVEGAEPVVTGHLDAGASALHGPFIVDALTRADFGLRAGTGTVAYVRFDERPTPLRFAARVEADRTVTVPVPDDATVAWVLVTAEAAAEYALFAPAEPVVTPEDDVRTRTFAGRLEEDAQVEHGPIDVTGAHRLRVVVDGSGDPDLFVAFDGRVTDVRLACESIAVGADECTLAIPPGKRVAWIEVYGATRTTYTATIEVR